VIRRIISKTGSSLSPSKKNPLAAVRSSRQEDFLYGKVEHLKPEEFDALISSGANNNHLDPK
jgi:hypothetical protein